MNNLIQPFERGIFLAGEKVQFRALLTDEMAAMQDVEFSLRYIRDDWRREDGSVASLKEGVETFWQPIPLRREGNKLLFEICFNGEHEHTLRLRAKGGGQEYNERFSFYSLFEDLAGLKAYKGNIHTHSTNSDGLLPPELMLPQLRKAGFDFCALTDHDFYTASYNDNNSGMECYPGEEASTYPSVNHVLSLGASEPVSEWRKAENSDFKNRVETLKKEEKFLQLPEHEREMAAQTEILFRKVRELGGLSVFCHPYWFCEDRYYSTPEENDFLLRHGSFDALELGNYRVPRMAILNAKIIELSREIGFNKPFVGSSDWHARPTQILDAAYTIIFAKSAAFADFAEAVRKGLCVAVGGYQDSFPFASLRLVKYACFLMEKYFAALHDPLCQKQGELMIKMQEDKDEKLQEQCEQQKKEIDSLREKFFISSTNSEADKNE